MNTGNTSVSCNFPNRAVKTPRSMLNSRNDKNCTSSELTRFGTDLALEWLRKDEFNPVRVHRIIAHEDAQWYFSVLASRIKVGSPTIWGLNDSQVELCQYKSHGDNSHWQYGINVKIPAVMATVGVQ